MKYSDQGNAILPNTFQHPNIFIDKLMFYLTPEENVVLTFATRRILGFQENISSRKDNISLSQFTSGLSSQKDGHTLSLGCGLGGTAVKNALDGLEKFRILLPTTDKPDARKGQEYWLQSSEDAIDWESLEKRRQEKDELSQKRTAKARCLVGQDSESVSCETGHQGLVGQEPKVLSDRNTKPMETHGNPVKRTQRKKIKKGDGVDAMLLTPEAQAEMLRITDILHTFERDLKRSDDLAGNETWRSFAKNFVIPQMDKGHDYQVYLDWYCSDPKRMEWAWKEDTDTIKRRWLMAWADQPVLPGIEVVPASEVPAPAPAPAYVPNPRLKQKNLAAFQRLESQG